jgi:plasmid stability protein
MSEKQNMPDLVIPDLDPATYERLRQAAAERGISLAQTARDLLSDKLQPSRTEVWAAADRLRKKIAKVSGNSTADIREWRDNVEPCHLDSKAPVRKARPNHEGRV